MQLCKICNATKNPAFESGECHVCRGKALETQRMVEDAVSLLSQEEIKSFSISSIIPKDWLIREEMGWDHSMGRKPASIKSIINGLIIDSLRKACKLPYRVDGDCRAIFDYSSGRVTIQRNELFVFGRYKKLVPGLSQSRWICQKCSGKGCKACGGRGKYYDSVEERIGKPMKRAANAGEYVMHASGREDVDATNSAGRAFVIMIKNPRIRDLDFEALSKEIEKSGEVSVSDLKIVSRGVVELVSESHLDKSYKAVVEFGKNLEKEELEKIKSLSGKTILQKTPKRVAHRRANLVRHRKIKEIKILEVDEMDKRAVIMITAEAGTYIKELISGDEGRTEPSIAGFLATSAVCKGLDVAKIDDGYLDFCLETMQ